MFLGKTHDGAGRSVAGDARDRSGASPVFCTACLVVLALAGAAVAAEPEAMPPPQPSPTSVLLPPIQPPPDRETGPLPSHALPFAQSSPQKPLQPPPHSPPLAEDERVPPASQGLGERTPLPQPTPAVPTVPQPAADEHDEETPQTPDTLRETLEREINQTFPNSSVRLKQTGDALVVSGSVRNLDEATSILSIVHQNAPDRVVNLLRVPREQAIGLRIVVAEVNRAAAHSLGLDFGIGDKQATIVPNRPSGAAGSPAPIGNGWIDQALHALEDLHYSQILAAPTLTTLNGQAARFQVGGEFPVPIVGRYPKGAVQGVHFHPYGVRLSVRPVVTDSNHIRLTVETDVRDADPCAAAQVNGTTVPGLKVRTFQSTVELQEGETLALADLIRAPTSDAEYQARAQGARPASAGNPSSEKELVVLVSPLLLRPQAKEHAGGSAKPLNPQDINNHPRGRDTVAPRADAPYLIGPRGYAGATWQEARRR